MLFPLNIKHEVKKTNCIMIIIAIVVGVIIINIVIQLGTI